MAGEAGEGGRAQRHTATLRGVTLRMSCSCLSTACTSSCNSQRNSSSCGDRPLSAAQARRPLHAPAARPRARAPHQHCPLHRCRCHRSRHSRRSPPSDRLPLAVRRPLGRSATLRATSASDWLSSSQPRPRTTSPASDWLSDARPAPGSKRCEIERSWRVSEPPALSPGTPPAPASGAASKGVFLLERCGPRPAPPRLR